MRIEITRLLHLLILAITVFPATSFADELEPSDGERILVLGSEFVEQQIKYNFLEANLTVKYPRKNIRWRNLGWSGDTPSAIARGYFNGEKEGWKRLKDELARIKPTMILVCYGANSQSDLFAKDFERMFAELKNHSDEIVVLSHPAAEELSLHKADVASANQSREKNAATLKAFVESQKSKSIRFVDLFTKTRFVDRNETRPWTHDSIRYNKYGYERIADFVASELGWNPAKNPEWSKEKYARLRSLIAEKNELYFHRYRPQNETYLRGFRKHEQGQNAKEIAQFDALIAQAEKRIQAFANGEDLPEPIVEPEDIELSFTAATIEEEKESFTLADGLEINLFAAEPMVANPIHMNFDSKGRLWVATSPIYPQIKPGAKPKDEIVVLEDTDGDGKADKRTVFANDLLIPTAVLPDEMGGAYVANSTELIHLQDTDGDGKADKRRVVLAGFGTEDTHHILHTFRWGPDASIYFNQSIYIHTHMETPQGVRRLMGSGIWRFEPQTVSASVLMRGSVNPWGHIFDDWGQSFMTDGAGGFGIHYAFPGSAYQTAVGYRETMRGMNPGQPKLCGLEIVTGRHFPHSWQNTLVTNDFRGNRIVRFELSEQDSGYASKQLPDLMTSSHRAFRPVDVKMAPDGSLMIADWYNPIINHGEVDFRDSRRDYKHGRIWRVTSKDRPLVKLPNFHDATIGELLDMMSLPERWSRTMARVEVRNRINRSPEEFKNELEAPISKLLNSDQPQQQLAGLWTLSAAGQFDTKPIYRAMSSTDHRVRAAAIRIVVDAGFSGKLNPDWMHKMLIDPHPQVRLEAINAWLVAGHHEYIKPLLAVFGKPTDKNIDFLLGQALRKTQSAWANSLADAELEFDQLFFIMKKTGAKECVPILKKRLLSKELRNEQQSQAIDLIAEFGSPNDLEELFAFSVGQSETKKANLAAIARAVQTRKLKLNIAAEKIKSEFPDPSAIQLAGLLRIGSLQEGVTLLANGRALATWPSRAAAVKSLGSYGDSDTLTQLARKTQPPAIRRLGINELLPFKPRLAAQLASDFLASAKTDLEKKEAVSAAQAFLSRRNGASLLVEALKGKPLSISVTQSLITTANRFGNQGKTLIRALRNSAASNKTKRTKSDIERLVKRVGESGDPARGELVYRRPKLNCIKCHAIGGAGGVVGPDMISLGASSPPDYIVQSLIEPNAKIKEGYHTTTVLTTDGKQVSGKLISELSGKLVMRDADDKEHVFKTDDIEAKKISPISLMPAELTDELSDKEFVDLAAFLCELGKEGSFKISSVPWVRTWHDEKGNTVISKVDGSLPMTDLDGQTASFEFEVAAPGAIGIEIDQPDGLRITLNDLTDNLRAKQIVKNLPKGKHRLNFKIMNKAKRNTLRVKLFEPEGSSGRAVLINKAGSSSKLK